VLGVSKPAGVLSHPSPGYWDAGTVAHALVGRVSEEMLQDRPDHREKDSFIPRAIVHRLDQGTTGAMVVAKTALAERGLEDVLRGNRAVDGSGAGADAPRLRKTYVALLLGCPRGAEGPGPHRLGVDAAIGRDPADPRRRAVVPGGQAASSVVHVHCHDESHGVSLATVDLITGRMHQIRVHCTHLGAPVACDPVYGDRKAHTALRRSLGPSLLSERRPLLHSWALELPHPRKGKEPLVLRAPLPDDMRGVITKLWPKLSLDPSSWPSSTPAAEKPRKRAKKAASPGAKLAKKAPSAPATEPSPSPPTKKVKKRRRVLEEDKGGDKQAGKKLKKKLAAPSGPAKDGSSAPRTKKLKRKSKATAGEVPLAGEPEERPAPAVRGELASGKPKKKRRAAPEQPTNGKKPKKKRRTA